VLLLHRLGGCQYWDTDDGRGCQLRKSKAAGPGPDQAFNLVGGSLVGARSVVPPSPFISSFVGAPLLCLLEPLSSVCAIFNNPGAFAVVELWWRRDVA
jgi:hypothetical protein